jgi:hypothetical protein
MKEDNRIKKEYKFLLNLYPDYLVDTKDIDLMKKAIKDLSNNEERQLLFIKQSLNSEKIKLNQIQIDNIEN